MTFEDNQNGNRKGYEILAERLREKYGSMTPEQIEEKWGKGMARYLQDVDDFVVYLGKLLKEVEERKERVPDEFYEQTDGLKFSGLREWYQAGEGLKAKEKRMKEVVYKGRMLELIAEKFEVKIEPINNGRRVDNRIRTSSDLKALCDTDPKARYLVELCGGDDIDVADIIAVVYDGRITREDAIKLLQEPSLRDYLGKFAKPIVDMDIIEECANNLLSLDKNEVIAGIVYRRLIEYRRRELGARPTEEQRNEFVREMSKRLEGLV